MRRDKKVPLFTRARAARSRKKMASVLTAHRMKRSLTLEACARRAKITPTRLERIENGAGHVYLGDLFGLAQAFRLRPSTLIKRIEEAVAPALPSSPGRRKTLQRGEAR